MLKCKLCNLNLFVKWNLGKYKIKGLSLISDHIARSKKLKYCLLPASSYVGTWIRRTHIKQKLKSAAMQASFTTTYLEVSVKHLAGGGFQMVSAVHYQAEG